MCSMILENDSLNYRVGTLCVNMQKLDELSTVTVQLQQNILNQHCAVYAKTTTAAYLSLTTD